ncbi:MAG: TA system VapC family ribonuclease toxin [Burkholderiaceae bacterium]
MTPDVNVLVAAARSDHPHHGIARAWLEGTFAEADSGVVCTLMPMVLASFLRLVTSPKIFQKPTPIEEAIGFVDALLLLPGAQLAELGAEWKRFRQLCLDKDLSANDVPDAWLAAAVAQRGEHLVSFDRDFRKLLGRAQFTLLASVST